MGEDPARVRRDRHLRRGRAGAQRADDQGLRTKRALTSPIVSAAWTGRRGQSSGADTSANAAIRVMTPRASSGSGSVNPIGPAAIVSAFAATLVTAITGTALPTGGCEPDDQAGERGGRDQDRQRVDQDLERAGFAEVAAERLDRGVGRCPEQACRGAEETPSRMFPRASQATTQAAPETTSRRPAGSPRTRSGPRRRCREGWLRGTPAERGKGAPIHSASSPRREERSAVTVSRTRPPQWWLGPARSGRGQGADVEAPAGHRDDDPEGYQGFRNSAKEVRRGRRMSTRGDAIAPDACRGTRAPTQRGAEASSRPI